MKLVSKIWAEVTSLLYWTMLAACTVGPGTVVTCARAGAEADLALLWALVFASVLAYILQEGTARLTIVSGMSLGQCMRVKYEGVARMFGASAICWAVAASVFIGNTLYEVNNWAGGVDAVLAFPGAAEIGGDLGTVVRVASCLVFAVVVVVLLYWDKTEKLGIMLGLVMMAMLVLFCVVVFYMGIDWTKLGFGLIPSIPHKTSPGSAEPADIILSLVGTTCIGYNLFLGGAMADGKTLAAARRGITFSTISALLVSSLILIVGAGSRTEMVEDSFTISQLSQFIRAYVGTVGVSVFALGFIAAALSSMLTVPLGAMITAESLLIADDKFKTEKTEDEEQKAALPRNIYLGLVLCMVTIPTIIISANADRIFVILLAQVLNGLLLPFLSICLLLCINDSQFMSSLPQTRMNNILLITTVTITMFLASNVIILKLLRSVLTQVYTRLIASASTAGVIMVVLCCTSNVGRNLWQG